MKYRLFTKSETAWHAMHEDIKAAQKSIYLESFILTDDSYTHNFFSSLKKKAKEGVRIKIIVDKVGDFWYGSINKKEFEEAGVEVIFFKRWFYRSHRKVLIIDDKIAYLGGVNIRREYANWVDLHVRLTGLLVKSALLSFRRVYELAGGKDPEILNLKKMPLRKARHSLYKAKAWFIEHWPFRGKSALRDYYKKKIRHAQKQITIVTPYFIPHRWLIKAIHAAFQRGVRVEVLIPRKTDVGIINAAHRIFVHQLGEFINFYFLSEMNHAKVLLVDEQEGLVGSNNIDALSFDTNLEASVIFQRKDIVGNIRHILEGWKKSAIPASKESLPLSWFDRILRPIIGIIQPFL